MNNITNLDNQFHIEKLEEFDLEALENNSHLKNYFLCNLTKGNFLFFEHKLFLYIYNELENNFSALKYNIKTSQENIHKFFSKGLNFSEVEYQKSIFGECDLNIKIDGVFSLLFEEITDFFVIFQIGSIIFWLLNYYAKFAVVIFFITAITIIISVYETRTNLINIKNMAKFSCKVNVLRENEVKMNSFPIKFFPF